MRKPPRYPLTVGDPALGGDIEGTEEEGSEAPSPTPDPRTAALERKILELQAKLAESVREAAPEFPTDPDALVMFDIPKGPTGFAIEIQGKRIVGPGPWPRRVLDQALHMLSVKQQSERERLHDRGTGFAESRLDAQDYGSRAMRRRQGRHVL